jgi:hypothetical protein
VGWEEFARRIYMPYAAAKPVKDKTKGRYRERAEEGVAVKDMARESFKVMGSYPVEDATALRMEICRVAMWEW